MRVSWLVDARLRGSQHYVGFHATDISLFGVRLRAPSTGDFERVIDRDRVDLLLRVPGSAGAAEVETEVKWQRVEQGHALLGCEFKRLSREVRRALGEYIDAHPQDLIAED